MITALYIVLRRYIAVVHRGCMLRPFLFPSHRRLYKATHVAAYCHFITRSPLAVKMHTTQEQFDIMVSFMEEHPEWARKETRDEALWDELVNELNAQDEFGRTKGQWKRVYYDYSRSLQGRASENQKLMRRDGAGPQAKELNTFDPIKRRLAELLNVNKRERLMVERDPEDNLQFLYAELQHHEALMDHIEEALGRLMQAIAALAQLVQNMALQM